MFLSNLRTIVFIEKQRILWTKGSVPRGGLLGEVWALPFSEENLIQAFNNIKEGFPSVLRIVIGEELSYVMGFSGKGKIKNSLDEMQTYIPEQLIEGWDSSEDNNGNVQLMAIQHDFFAILKRCLAGFDFEVGALEVESVAIGRMLPKKEEKALFLKYGEKSVVGAFKDGKILATRIFFEYPGEKAIKEFAEYVSHRDAIGFEKVYLEDLGDKEGVKFPDLGMEVAYQSLDPMVGICRKEDIQGEDRETLNILLEMSNKEKDKKIKNITRFFSFREKIIFAIFVTVFLLGMIFIFQH